MSERTRGERIGRFRVERVVGAGGFATVLEAVDERLEDHVAIKILAENHSLDPDVRARFLSEGRVLRRVDSPHVVRVLDLGETDRQQPYLVLELADRGDLASRAERLRADGWQPSAVDLLAVIRPLTDALEAVHRADVVHRDVSPGNVLLTSTLAPSADSGRSPLVAEDERVVLADLGLCKDLARSSGLTVAGGTEGFRPPEQRGAPNAVDARADLWSLSAMVVWLLTGDAPRDAAHARRLLADHDLPEGLPEAVLTSMSGDPADRHEDVAAWREAVVGCLAAHLTPGPASQDDQGLTTGTTDAAGTPDGPGRADAGDDRAAASMARPPRPSPAGQRFVVIAAVLGIAVGARGTWLLSGDPRPSVEVVDGQAHVTRADGSLEATLVGPVSVDAGEVATFEVVADGAVSWVWIAPDGRAHADVPAIEVRTASPGFATVVLVAAGADGERARVEHRLRVRDP